MGGDYYDRDVISVSNNTTSDYTKNFSAHSDAILSKINEMHFSMNPIRWKDETLQSESREPIVFALDVTGSMGDWTKIIYDKMPMFYGQIMMQNYLLDPSISFCAIGDAYTDLAPLQITEFGQGKSIDQLISKMWLEGNGGGNKKESYEIAAYFYTSAVELVNAELPFFFLTGDEGYYDTIKDETLYKIFQKHSKQQNINSFEVFQKLKDKYNVFLIKKQFCPRKDDAVIRKQWIETLGEERILDITNPKACIDVILGAIAITSGSRNLEGYVEDMKNRGQTDERINEVVSALNLYSKKLENREVKIVINKVDKKEKKVDIDIKNEIRNEQINVLGNVQNDFTEVLEMYEKLLLNELDEKGLLYRKSLIQLHKIMGDNVPEELLCPITKEIFYDPVLASDGYSYERKALECWLLKHKNSPVTNNYLPHHNLLPNFILKQSVQDYYDTWKDMVKIK